MENNKPSISVIFPLYGFNHLERASLVLDYILFQRNVQTEIIIAGLNSAYKVKRVSDLKVVDEKIPKIVKTGTILNRGLHISNGKFVYVTDGDILIPDSNYFLNLVNEYFGRGTFLKRPPMRRLLLEDFDWFNQVARTNGLERSFGPVDYSQDFIIKPKDKARFIKVFKKFENGRDKTFIISEKDFQEYTSSEKNKGSEPRYFNQEIHCGATFAPKQSFLDIGGYHEGFVSWGVWDADLQWKLEYLGKMSLIPKRKEFEVIHLDHEKGYFDKNKWDQDKLLQAERRKIGSFNCILEDKKFFEDNYGN